MSSWTNHPFLRIVLTFALGIAAIRYDLIPYLKINIYLILILPLFVLVGKLIFKNIPNSLWGNILLITVFLIGASRYAYFDRSGEKSNIPNKWTNCQAYIGTITSFPTDKEKFTIHQLDLNLGILDSTPVKMPIKLLLYEKKDPAIPSQLNYGDKILIEGQPSAIATPRNPYEFDFSRYMADQHIYFQQFATADQIKIIAKHQASDLMSAVYRIRSYFENVIKSQIKGDKEEAIVLALLLGIKGQLDPEIKSAYAAAGAMHVLAVSGLHVSIIYFILNWLFRGLPHGDLRRLVTPTISIVALWLYALLTGFSPSILRAVAMFSVIIFAKILDRKGQVFNSLAFAAFLLLLFDPSFLFNVGFQLSFLAVAGIVYIHPRLYQLWEVKNRIGNYFWQITCVSIAAQIATFPLSLYYFHQFPSYFLMANLVVIPAALATMILGIAVLALGSFTHWFGWLLENIVCFMNWFVDLIQHLEGNVIDWIYISSIQVWLIYLIILAFFALLKFKKSSYAWVILLATIGFSLDRLSLIINQSVNKELVFYSSNRNKIIDHVEEFEAELLTLDSIVGFKNESRYVSPYRIHRLLSKPTKPHIIRDGLTDFAKMKVFNGKRVLFLTKPFDINQIQFRLQAEIVVISNQSVDSLSMLDQIVGFEEVILDHSNGNIYTTRLKKEAADLEMNLFSLRDQAHLITLSRNKKFLDMLF